MLLLSAVVIHDGTYGIGLSNFGHPPIQDLMLSFVRLSIISIPTLILGFLRLQLYHLNTINYYP